MTTVTHREFIKDIITDPTGSNFKIESFAVQPGNAATFPWLSTIAQNYEQYYVHGIQFLFRSSAGDNTTSGQAGNVVMAAEYNVNAPAYTNKQYMENSVGAKSTKQQNSMIFTMMHVDNVFFTRQGAIPTGDSLKFYDHSIFQISTQGFQGNNFNAGELWVAYKITFLKPQVPRALGGTPAFGRLVRLGAGTGGGVNNYNGVTAAGNAVGTIGITASGSPVNGLIITNVLVGNIYTITHHWVGTATGFVNPSYGAVGGGITRNLYAGALNSTAYGGTGGAAVTSATSEICVEATANTITLSFNAGTIPATSAVDILVRAVDPAAL